MQTQTEGDPAPKQKTAPPREGSGTVKPTVAVPSSNDIEIRVKARAARAEEKKRQFNAWLEHGSPDLRLAWVSVCAWAKTHETTSFRLTEVVEIIQNTKTIDGRNGRTVDLEELGKRVQGLYNAGFKEANDLNRLTLGKIAKALNIDPTGLEPVYTQPKGNEKKYSIPQVRSPDGTEYACPEPHRPYHHPVAEGKARASAAKQNEAPAVLFAGVFRPIRDNENMQGSTGLYPLDLDGVADIPATEEKIDADPNVFLNFLSITGSGLKPVVRGPVAHDAATYTANYRRLAKLKSEQWGVKEDPATNECARLCFLSFDPQAYVNWDAVPVTLDELEAVVITPPAATEPKQKKSAATEPKTANGKKAKTPTGTNVTVEHEDSAPPLEIDWGEVPDLNWEGIRLATVLDAMRHIRLSNDDREKWRATLAALKFGFGEDAFLFADLWSSHQPKYKDTEDVRATWDSHDRTNRERCNTPRTILKYAKDGGWKQRYDKPAVWLPTSSTSAFCEAVYTIMRPTETVFVQGSMVAVEGEGAAARIVDVDAYKGIRIFEKHIQFFAYKDKKTLPVALCEKHAKTLVKAISPGELPPLNGLLRFPPLIRTGEQLEIAAPGYIQESGWFNAALEAVQTVNFDEAVASLRELYKDFDFASPGDRSRALVYPIGVALKLCGLISGPAPMDFGTANDQQSGKSLRQKMTAAFFCSVCEQVTQREQGHGSTWENFQHACLEGKTFIQLDNFDAYHSQEMEAFLTGKSVPMRVAYGKGRSVNPANFIVSITSNGLASRRDLALRSWFIAIRKRPAQHAFTNYPEGELDQHVAAKQSHYLGCLYSIIMQWWSEGADKTDERRHSFTEFTQTCDWIAQNLFGEAPVMDGHDDAVEHHSDGGRVLFARLWDIQERGGKLSIPQRAGQLGNLAHRKSLAIPGMKSTTPRDEESIAKLIGGVAATLFADADKIDLGQGRTVRRIETTGHVSIMPEDEDDCGPSPGRYKGKSYVFERAGHPAENGEDTEVGFRDILIRRLGGAPLDVTVSTQEIAKFYKKVNPDRAGKWMSRVQARWPENFVKERTNEARQWRIVWP